MSRRQLVNGAVCLDSSEPISHKFRAQSTHRGDPGGGHLLEEPLRPGGVEAVDGVPAVLLRAQLDRLHVLVAVLADLQRSSRVVGLVEVDMQII